MTSRTESPHPLICSAPPKVSTVAAGSKQQRVTREGSPNEFKKVSISRRGF